MVVHCKGLTKRYGKFLILNDLDFSIEKGSITGLVGPNGSGKTTLLKSIMALHTIEDGDISIFDKRIFTKGRINESNYENVSKYLGYLPEEQALYNHLTPREYLDLVAILYNSKKEVREQRIHDLIDIFKLSTWADRMVGTLSKGNKQRLSLAATLITRPKILILDEPMNSLDPSGRRIVLDILQDYNSGNLKKLGINEPSTVFFSTHLLDDVEKICSNIMIMDHGGDIVSSGKIEKVIAQLEENERLETVYLSIVEGWQDEEDLDEYDY